MTEDTTANECPDTTENLTIELPCQIVERVERYAKENGTDFTGVLTEALDQFMRNQGNRK